ncbi:MAG: hypothetical protein M5T61_18705 [Acidimicrobiia bacterium]|nr:hypothetical protein [Acidimicrobiia bacterium]
MRVVEPMEKQAQAQDHTDRNAGEDADHDHSEERSGGEHELVSVSAPDVRELGQVDHPGHGLDDDRGERGLGQALEEPGEEEDRQQDRDRGDRKDDR